MAARFLTQGTIQKTTAFEQSTYLLSWVESFLIDRKTQNMSPGTLYFYRKKLRLFCQFCDGQAITQIPQIAPNDVRAWLLWLEEKGHNPGGIHACYRALRAFLRWYESEAEPEGWRNPIAKVKAPKVAIEPLEPVDLGDLRAMLITCNKSLLGLRDRAALLFLLDTGARASEFLALNLEDVNPITGAAIIRQGKGRKPRTVFIGKAARKALRAYLTHRQDTAPALWVTDEGERLTYWGLRSMVARRARAAGVAAPELHAFRRGFALSMLRAGVDVYSLQRLMGHSDLQTLRRYLRQDDTDLAAAHGRGSPVDNLL